MGFGVGAGLSDKGTDIGSDTGSYPAHHGEHEYHGDVATHAGQGYGNGLAEDGRGANRLLHFSTRDIGKAGGEQYDEKQQADKRSGIQNGF